VKNQKIRSTTILGVRSKRKVAIAGDGQVTFGDMAMKQKAVKVRKFDSPKGGVVGGFSGAAADDLTLFEKFEQKLEEYEGELKRSVVEMAKDWRMDKMLRHLEALLLVMDKKDSFIIAGDGNVIEPDGPCFDWLRRRFCASSSYRLSSIWKILCKKNCRGIFKNCCWIMYLYK
jgi:ATP-dependent HslUV protease subunit HslV